MDDRAITYESQLIGQYTRQGSNYKEPNVISIWIIRDPITHGPMARRNCPIENAFVHLEENTWCKKCTRLSNRFKIIFVHLSRFKDDKLLEPLSELMIDWANFFSDPSNVNNTDKGMKDAKHIWTKVSGDKVVKEQIKAIEKYEMDKRSEITVAKREGIKEGEMKKMRELANNMKNQGFENEVTAKCLNISIDELNKLFGV